MGCACSSAICASDTGLCTKTGSDLQTIIVCRCVPNPPQVLSLITDEKSTSIEREITIKYYFKAALSVFPTRTRATQLSFCLRQAKIPYVASPKLQ